MVIIHLTNSNWKPHLNLVRVFDVSLEMSGDAKIILVLHKINLLSFCLP